MQVLVRIDGGKASATSTDPPFEVEVPAALVRRRFSRQPKDGPIEGLFSAEIVHGVLEIGERLS